MTCVSRLYGLEVHLDLFQGSTPYCEGVPSRGAATLVFDLMSPELRTMPLAVVVEALEGAHAGTVLYIPPRTYPFGVVIAEGVFDPGKYRAMVSYQGGDGLWQSFHFQFRVGPVPFAEAAARAVVTFGPWVLAAAIAGYSFYRFRRGSLGHAG